MFYPTYVWPEEETSAIRLAVTAQNVSQYQRPKLLVKNVLLDHSLADLRRESATQLF